MEASLIIGGHAVGAEGGSTFERRGPADGATATRAAAAGEADVRAAASAAAAAFHDWSRTAAEQRAQILRKTSDILADMRDPLFQAAHEELGCSRSWVDFNIQVAKDLLSEAEKLCHVPRNTAQTPGHPGVTNILRHEPVGVVLGIAPWNAPITLAVRAVAAPIALGNAAILKGSELCPRTHQLVVEAFHDAGLPPGVLNFLTNAPEHSEMIVEALIAHPAVRRVNFTGSTRVGRLVAMQAARHLKRCVLELSGKAPTIVLEDADLDMAADAIAFSAYFNSGQVCMSTDLVIVPEALGDRMVAKLCERAQEIAARRTDDGGPWHGSLISVEAGQRLQSLLNDAQRWGGDIACGGTIAGTSMAPTVVDHVSSAMRLYKEECFGPIAAVLRVADVDEAISIANSSDFGLAASIFSRDTAQALQLAERIESGICHVNGPTVYDDPSMPFGGMKASGFGRIGGPSSLEEFTETRWLSVHDRPPGTPA